MPTCTEFGHNFVMVVLTSRSQTQVIFCTKCGETRVLEIPDKVENQ